MSSDDDDGPIVFKRNTATSRQNQPSSQSQVVGQSNGKKGKIDTSDKSLGSPSSKKISHQPKPSPKPIIAPTEQVDDSDDKKPLKPRLSDDKKPLKPRLSDVSSKGNLKHASKGVSSSTPVSSSKNKVKKSSQSSDEDDDSEDEKPLKFRLSDVYSKGNLNHASKGVSSSTPVSSSKNMVKKSSQSSDEDDDTEDEKPLKFRLSDVSSKGNLNHASKGISSSTPVSSSKNIVKKSCQSSDEDDNSEDEKPLKFRLSDVSSKGNLKYASKGVSSSTPVSSSRNIVKKSSQSSDEDNDSEDEKPLKFRLSDVSSKGNLNHESKGVSSSTPVSSSKHIVKKSSESSDEDDKPLASRFPMKPNVSLSSNKSCDRETKPHIVSKLQQNGSISRERERKPPTLLHKRPLDKINSSSQTLVKKLKPSDTSPQVNNKSPSIKKELKGDDDAVPISQRMKKANISASPQVNSKSLPIKTELKGDDDDDDVPISQRMKKANISDSKPLSSKQKEEKVRASSIKKTTKFSKKITQRTTYSKSTKVIPKSGEGQKWTTLVHNGVIFPPSYKPHGIKMLYKGKPVDLTPEQEEVATMFAVMIDSDFAQKEKFVENFMNDWRKILGKSHVIQKFSDCDFKPIYEWHQREKEKKKQMTTEEKKVLKEEKSKLEEKYMWAIVDGVKEKVGNFRVEPPGLFRGRGEHPKMGKLKSRIRPSDITINIGKGVPIPECPIPGERWREVKHDNTVTWLAFWNDPINSKEFKYVFLAASSSLKGQSDKEKYEKARKLKDYIQQIRISYMKDFVSKDITKRQIAVATYLIDKLALRAGNEKEDDEADTVGCCTLKVENVKLIPPNKLEFDFLGKDSIRYNNVVEVELPVYMAIGQFQRGKKDGDDLFDELDTGKLNAHLKELMPGLSAKVFRTYNASITLDEMLTRDTKGGEVAEKIGVYNHANKEVAIICNHQRSISKTHDSQMSRLDEKINELKGVIEELEADLARAKKGKPPLKDADGKQKKNLTPEVLERKISQTNAKIEKMERDKHTKEDLKTVALGTSKINYLDPRISVAWCKRHEVAIEKIFNKSLLAKFTWAMDVDPSFRF